MKKVTDKNKQFVKAPPTVAAGDASNQGPKIYRLFEGEGEIN